MPGPWRYCPVCSMPLTTKMEGGRDRVACSDDTCGFMHFGNFSIGCAGVVIRDGKALIIQRGIEPFRGSWQIPGGYAEADEPILEAVEREVREESGVVAKVRDVVGFRHSVGGSIGGPATNIYLVFRLDYVSGEPSDADSEVMGAGFFSLEEMEEIPGVQGLSKWAIQKALAVEEFGPGLAPDRLGGPVRPGFSVFGLGGNAFTEEA